jgi:hypothetical protein
MDNLFRADVTDEDPASALSIVQFMRKLKYEYYCRIGRKVDEAFLGAQQTHLAITRKRSFANRITRTEISSRARTADAARSATTPQTSAATLANHCARIAGKIAAHKRKESLRKTVMWLKKTILRTILLDLRRPSASP